MKNSRSWVKGIAYIGIMLSLLIFPISHVEGVYIDWDYKTKIKLSNSGAEAGDCPVLIYVPARLYIDADRMNTNCGDIRFSDESGNELSHWTSITEGMDRKINSLPIWVKVPSLPNGTSYLYMHFDKDEADTTCGPCGSPESPNCGNTCGDDTFNVYSMDLNDDDDWNRSGSYKDANTKFVGKDNVGNTFIINFRTHCYTEKEMVVYLLTQDNSNAANVDTYDGYKMYIDFDALASDNTHYNRGRWNIRFYKQEGGGGWGTEIHSFTWYAYNNSIQDFEIRVGTSDIKVKINGMSQTTVTRTDTTFGADCYVGFDRMNWSTSGEGGSNSSDGISPVWVRKYISADPEVEFVGHADLHIKRIQPTADGSYTGTDVIEVTAEQQRLEDSVSGNILDKYIYNSYDIAEPDQMFKFKMKVKNRGDTSDTLNISVEKMAVDPSQWFVAYSYDSYVRVTNLPGGTSTAGQVTLSPGGYKEVEIFVMPSSTVLAEGGLGTLSLNIGITAQGDLSFDTGRFIANVKGKSGCYWAKKMPITISYPDTYGTGNLLDYQVLVSLSGMDFSDANADGSDIMFTDVDGTVIPFWMKSFDKSGGAGSHIGAFWVNVPNIFSGASTTVYMWWGNSSASSRSSIEDTFDLWKDFAARTVDQVVGCDDGTTDCSSLPNDSGGWENNPTPDDNYDWWRIKSTGGSNALMADKGSSHTSSDIGPLITTGDINWKNYEVMYKFYDDYDNYSGSGNPWGNPQYNPIYFQDPGNEWGMEFFADKYIFRPFAHGTDYTWIYQAYANGILGQDFPKKDSWYGIKVRAFNNPSTGQIHLTLLSTPADTLPSDMDSDAGFSIIGDFNADPAFVLDGGKIGFGGWHGGFSFDDIRVRKFVEPEPTYSAGAVVDVGYAPISSLSFPIVAGPFLNGRPVYLKATVNPWQWRGDLMAFYADCLFFGDCEGSEDSAHIGTFSIWGSEDNDTPNGFGAHLMAATAGNNNRATTDDLNWKTNGRYIFTAGDTDPTPDNIIGQGEVIDFEVSQWATLQGLLGTANQTDTENLIKYVRGQYIPGYPKSDTRDMDMDADPGTHTDDEQWKLGDIIHSSPLVIGLPAMAIPGEDYADFSEANSNRDMVVYFGSNEGSVHAVRLAKYDSDVRRLVGDTDGTELWTFIPNTILNKLTNTTDNYHEYTVDGILRAIDAELSDGNYHTILVGILRSGGISAFAMDVTDPTSPPVLLWEINGEGDFDLDQDNDVDSDDSTIASQIGEVWSAPALGRLRGTVEKEVAIFGSGFAANDIEHLSKKAYLTVVDLETGEVINQLKLSDKIGNSLTDIIPVRDQNGYLERIYMGDMYGVVWRFDLDTATKGDNFLSATTAGNGDMLFKPGDYLTSDITSSANFPDRPISVPPSIAYGASSGEFWVYFGTGLFDDYDANYPYQRFHGIKDGLPASPYVDIDLANQTCTSSCYEGFTGSPPSHCADPCETATNGWYIELGHDDERDVEVGGSPITKDRNERVLTFCEVYAGYVFFTTYTPTSDPCGGGNSYIYVVDYDTGNVTVDASMDINGDDEVTSADKVTPPGGDTTSARGLKLGSGIPTAPRIVTSGDKLKVVVGKSGSDTPAKVTLNPDMLRTGAQVILWRERK